MSLIPDKGRFLVWKVLGPSIRRFESSRPWKTLVQELVQRRQQQVRLVVVDGTVDGRNTANHLGCEISLQNNGIILPISTG